ncbi:head GIN domain-containing protein [Formosa sp. L2A11]|uniref:head GIN domain-containing protein n=1 Tax=Formosa sp. L2A11 TaxID=2686363 RepID=UPI00131C2842|nr:head GIN domain-containing protein [Formosa sp. L2A11]
MKTVNFKIAIIFATLAISLNSCVSINKGIQGNGEYITDQRTTSSYDNVSCSGSMNYILVQGTEGQITVEGESNLVPYIITEVQGNTLTVRTEDGINLSPSNNRDIIITIPFKDLSEVSLTGSGDLINHDVISSENLKVGITGSGDVILDINTTHVEGSVTGSGDLTLNGKTESLNFSVTGSGDFHGYRLESKNADISVTGSGDAEVMATSFLKARVSGSGDIAYKGHPEKEDTKVSGSGSIEMN